MSENEDPSDDLNYQTGAVRSNSAEDYRFDLIHPVIMFALGRTLHEGSQKYGSYNWEQGMPVSDLLNHGLQHIFKYLAGQRDEPHLEHALWNIGAAIVSDVMWPGLNTNMRSEGCEPSEEAIKMLNYSRSHLEEFRRKHGESLGQWSTAELQAVIKMVSSPRK